MSKRNMWLGIGGAVIIVAIIAGVLVHNNKSNDNSTAPSTNSTASSSQTPSSSSNTPNQPASSEIITTKTDPTAGEFLADSSGNPLYTYASDTAGVSNCTGACLANWPIYGPTSSSSSLPANVTVITRSDSKAQYAYKGLPLYFFSGDSNGTPTGDNVGGFHLAKP